MRVMERRKKLGPVFRHFGWNELPPRILLEVGRPAYEHLVIRVGGITNFDRDRKITEVARDRREYTRVLKRPGTGSQTGRVVMVSVVTGDLKGNRWLKWRRIAEVWSSQLSETLAPLYGLNKTVWIAAEDLAAEEMMRTDPPCHGWILDTPFISLADAVTVYRGQFQKPIAMLNSTLPIEHQLGRLGVPRPLVYEHLMKRRSIVGHVRHDHLSFTHHLPTLDLLARPGGHGSSPPDP